MEFCKSFNETCDEIHNNTVTLDNYEWKTITFLLHVSDSNGVGDISQVKYKIKGNLSE